MADLKTSFSSGSIRGSIRDGFGNLDTVIDIENIQGTQFGDSFVGSRADNVFSGAEGKDTYNGGAGFDRVKFDDWFKDDEPTGITVNLTLASGQIINDGFGNTETARNIEFIDGTDRNDRIRMNGAENAINGREGTDTLTGGGGSDTFFFIDQGELGDGDRITDFTASGSASDHLAFDIDNFDGMTSTVRLVNGNAATTNQGTFLFRAFNDTLYWDRDGTGAAAAQVVAILTNVAALSTDDVELY